MSDIWSRQDGHDPERDENCATGLCEHERGSALRPPVRRPGSLSVLAAFFGDRDRDDREDTS
jgi:hypothetical protein